MQKECKDAVFEIAKRLSDFENVLHVISYGSVVRSEAAGESDLDLLIVLDPLEQKEEIKDILFDVEEKFRVRVQPIFSNKSFTGLDKTLIEAVLREGIVLYSRGIFLKTKELSLLPYLIYSFELKNLPQKEKTKVKRALYGSITFSSYGKKKYKSETKGLLVLLGGERIGRGAFIIEERKSRDVEEVLRRFHVSFRKIGIWKSA